MFVAPGLSQEPGSLVPMALIVITGLVVFWRTAIKILAIAVILLVALGLSELLHTLHWYPLADKCAVSLLSARLQSRPIQWGLTLKYMAH